MLKNNTKKAKQNAWEVIKYHLTEDGNDAEAVEKLKTNIKAAPGFGTYQQAAALVDGGFFSCYYYDCRKDLQNILEETDEEAEKYSDSQVWNQYRHTMASAIVYSLEKYEKQGGGVLWN